MLTEEQWLARQKKKKDAGGAGSSSGEARRRPRGGRKQKGKNAKQWRSQKQSIGGGNLPIKSIRPCLVPKTFGKSTL